MIAQKKWGPNTAFVVLLGVFLFIYFVPLESSRVTQAIQEGFVMLGDYAREHVLLCLIPAFFIAGAISVFLNQQSVIKYLGPTSPKPLAYGVASVSGVILAVCSCTVLPLFKGIYKKGAGLGPAISFLYSGPAISTLAIILSYKVFGWQLGLARMVGAIIFSVLIGLFMGIIFRNEDAQRVRDARGFQSSFEQHERPLWVTALNLASMVGILVFLNWAYSGGNNQLWDIIWTWKWFIAAAFGLVLLLTLVRWHQRAELIEWIKSSRDFSIQVLPLLFAGVLLAGFFLGRPSHEGLIPRDWVSSLVGGNSLLSNLLASVLGALMYFATLTEVPIVQGLLDSGMGHGPALALLLAGPSLSLPSILVIWGELGARKTLVYVTLVVVLSTFAGLAFGYLN